jgi:hypothetical protein
MFEQVGKWLCNNTISLTVRPKKPLSSVKLVGVGQCSKYAVLLGSVATPLEEMIWPKYSNWV